VVCASKGAVEDQIGELKPPQMLRLREIGREYEATGIDPTAQKRNAGAGLGGLLPSSNPEANSRTARAHSHDGDVVGVEVLAKSVVGRAAPAVGGTHAGALDADGKQAIADAAAQLVAQRPISYIEVGHQEVAHDARFVDLTDRPSS
jgi:hypothetical protein